MSLRSMTGFGRADGELAGLAVSVEVQSVNRRNLEILVNLPREWQPLEREINAILQGPLSRGKVYVHVNIGSLAGDGGFTWDAQGLESSLRRLGAVAQAHGVAWPPTADALVKLAALNKVEVRVPPLETAEALVLELVRGALGAMDHMRIQEGAALRTDLEARCDEMAVALATIAADAAERSAQYRKMLTQRLSAAGLSLELNDERVLKEVAIFADRCDISEETTRLSSHLEQMREAIAAGSPIGRKLEFIVQEVQRELNTMGSKSNSVEVSRRVIDAKNALEKLREQVQNIE